MKFAARVASCVPVQSARSLFHPAIVQQQTILVWTALAQLDPVRVRRAHRIASPYHDALELEVNIVDQQTMAVVSAHLKADAEKEKANRLDRRPRHFHRNLHPAATDILAFPDHTVIRALSSRCGASSSSLLSSSLIDQLCRDEAELQTDAPSCAGAIFMCPAQMCANLGPESSSRKRFNLQTYVLSALTHSLLHIYGYRHETDQECCEMVAIERRVGRAVHCWNNSDNK